MTNAQTDALRAAGRLLGEHFDGSVISVSAEEDDGSAANHVRVPSGSAFTGLGLLEAAKMQILAHGHTFQVGLPPDGGSN